MKYLLCFFIAASSLLYAQDETITFMSYNLLNFPNGRDDCGTNVVVPNRADTLKKIIDYVQPDIFGACEVQTQAGVDAVLNQALNTGGNTNFAAATFYPSSDLGVALFYNTDKLVLKTQNSIVSYPRPIMHYVLYVKDPQLSVYLDTTFIDVYMVHLKAGSTTTDENSRDAQTQVLMNYIAQQTPNHNVFVTGDMNVYSSYGAGYQNMTSGQNSLNDPINKPGNWHNNSSFAPYHTQATRRNLNYDCGVKGGLDDRFDQILVSQNVLSGDDHVAYQTGSYKAVGNDGNHYNDALIDGTNATYPESLVNALFYMSDHLPVELKVGVTFPTSGLALKYSSTNVSCNGANDGMAAVLPHLGQAPYTYQWGSKTGYQTAQTATNLGPGIYHVVVTDANGETSDCYITISEPDALAYSSFVTPDDGSCSGSIQLLVGGGTPPYTYHWTDFPTMDTNRIENLCVGTYAVEVTDANGCQLLISATVSEQAGVKAESDVSQKILVFPNPAKNNISIKSAQPIESILLFSMKGEQMNIPIQKVSKGEIMLYTTGLVNGNYTLRITTNTGGVSKTFVVKH